MSLDQLIAIWNGWCVEAKHTKGFDRSVMDLTVEGGLIRVKKDELKFMPYDGDPQVHEITQAQYDELARIFNATI